MLIPASCTSVLRRLMVRSGRVTKYTRETQNSRVTPDPHWNETTWLESGAGHLVYFTLFKDTFILMHCKVLLNSGL